MPANWVLLKGCTQYASIWKTQQWPQDWKRSAFIPTPKKGNAKEHSNYCMIVLISHPGKVILKSLQARLNSMWTKSFQMFKLDLEKAEKPEIKLPTFVGSSKKAREFKKSIYFCFIDYAKAFDCVDQTNCGKFLKRWEYQTTLPASWEICMRIKKQQLELDIEQWTGFKWERSTSGLYIVTLLI